MESRIKRKSKKVRVYEEEQLERKKQKKNKATLDHESEILEVAPEGELAVARGSGDAMDDVVRKRKKREKNTSKTDGVEMGNAKEVETNEIKELLEGESTSGLESSKETSKEKKKNKKAKSNKKVRFSDKDDVFTLPYDSNTDKGTDEEGDLLRGKRFTSEEDEIVREAVYTYILDHDLGEEGLEMVLNSRKHPQLKGCWREIGLAIPYRPYTSVYYRAQILFKRSEDRKWTQEEYDMILKHQEERGNEWKDLADELGKHRFHVKDTWRRIKLRNMNKGHWTQEEYQKFFDLVNTDLQLKVTEEKRSKHGMLRDNICWTGISDKLSTRSQANCCKKWYKQLTSPMVQEGVWADTDDYRLLGELYSLDATCMEDVDWDNLVDGRPGDICRKRWNQMAMHIGQHGRKSFAEQVEVLAQRYCPNLLEARETWDSKPRVP